MPANSEKSTDLNRKENITKGNVSAKRVALYHYNASTDTIENGVGDTPSYATRLDDSADPVIYVGKAQVGSAESSEVWQIAKLDTSSGLVKTWAGTADFSYAWSDRASLTYN